MQSCHQSLSLPYHTHPHLHQMLLHHESRKQSIRLYGLRRVSSPTMTSCRTHFLPSRLQIWIKYAVPFMQKGTLHFIQNGTLPFMPHGTLANPLSNVRRWWPAMPLGAGFLRWVLACRTIEKKSNLDPRTHAHPTVQD